MKFFGVYVVLAALGILVVAATLKIASLPAARHAPPRSELANVKRDFTKLGQRAASGMGELLTYSTCVKAQTGAHNYVCELSFSSGLSENATIYSLSYRHGEVLDVKVVG